MQSKSDVNKIIGRKRFIVNILKFIKFINLMLSWVATSLDCAVPAIYKIQDKIEQTINQ